MTLLMSQKITVICGNVCLRAIYIYIYIYTVYFKPKYFIFLLAKGSIHNSQKLMLNPFETGVFTCHFLLGTSSIPKK